MTTKELVSKYRLIGPQELRVFLHFLADHWHELRLIGGGRLNDNIDSAAALRELAEAFRLPLNSESIELPHWDRTCPKCFHVHEKDSECGVDLGKGGYCECKAEVTA